MLSESKAIDGVTEHETCAQLAAVHAHALQGLSSRVQQQRPTPYYEKCQGERLLQMRSKRQAPGCSNTHCYTADALSEQPAGARSAHAQKHVAKRVRTR
jgi:hypothetical protein